MEPWSSPLVQVRVVTGRWKGRTGYVVGTKVNPGRPGGQQSQTYPVVALQARGRAKARTVTVLAVEEVIHHCRYGDTNGDGDCPHGFTRFVIDENGAR